MAGVGAQAFTCTPIWSISTPSPSGRGPASQALTLERLLSPPKTLMKTFWSDLELGGGLSLL